MDYVGVITHLITNLLLTSWDIQACIFSVLVVMILLFLSYTPPEN